MTTPITMGSFIYCDLIRTPLLTNTCAECDFFLTREDGFYCTYKDKDAKNEVNKEEEEEQDCKYSIKELILKLLELMENGTSRLSRDEIEELLDFK